MRERIRAGDHAAFGELFDECAGVVYRHAYRLVGDWAVAEDVTSLAFLHAWRARATVAAEGASLRPWLLGIATNVARNVRRAARRERLALERLPEAPVVADFAQALVDQLVDAEAVAEVQRAMGMLRRGEREVIALHVWAELSYEETAQALGIPVGTVKSRLSRARKRLERELGSRGRQTEGDREIAVRPRKETR